jgi:hypothetical protein
MRFTALFGGFRPGQEMGGAKFGPDICNSAREGSDISPSWERILYELDVGAK